MKLIQTIILFSILAFVAPVDICGQTLTEEPSITQMREGFIDYNIRNQTVRGWRIQVIVTNDRRQMEATQKEFKRKFQDYELHFTHDKPFYHLKVGAFTSQHAALPFLKLIQENYPNAFLVSDEVELEEVLTYL